MLDRIRGCGGGLGREKEAGMRVWVVEEFMDSRDEGPGGGRGYVLERWTVRDGEDRAVERGRGGWLWEETG